MSSAHVSAHRTSCEWKHNCMHAMWQRGRARHASCPKLLSHSKPGIIARVNICSPNSIVKACQPCHRRWFMRVYVALQMTLFPRLFSPLLTLHSWRACACTAARHVRIKVRTNQTLIIMRGHTLASDCLCVICVGTRASQLAI